MEQINTNMEVSQRSEFSCCYILNKTNRKYSSNYELIPHDYKFEISVSLKPNVELNDDSKLIRVISFEDLKGMIDKVLPFDSFLFNTTDLRQSVIARDFVSVKIPTVGFKSDISAEILLTYITSQLVSILEESYPDLYVKETKLRESVSSFVVWKQEV